MGRSDEKRGKRRLLGQPNFKPITRPMKKPVPRGSIPNRIAAYCIASGPSPLPTWRYFCISLMFKTPKYRPAATAINPIRAIFNAFFTRKPRTRPTTNGMARNPYPGIPPNETFGIWPIAIFNSSSQTLGGISDGLIVIGMVVDVYLAFSLLLLP